MVGWPLRTECPRANTYKLGGNNFSNRALMGITNNPLDPVERRQFAGPPLGITTCHQNFRPGVLTMNAPNGLARVLVGLMGDRAGVNNDYV